jgi:hypothetical protein
MRHDTESDTSGLLREGARAGLHHPNRMFFFQERDSAGRRKVRAGKSMF